MRLVTILAFLIMFFSVFGLFFIFDNLNKIAEECQKPNPSVSRAICNSFTGFNMNILLVLLIIGGFVLVLSSTIFILIR
ncbi:MAG: hypothetical protein ACP5JK_02325 [Candidatus Aenigmatarchaeota archaeon]